MGQTDWGKLVDQAGFEPIPQGDYDVEIDTAQPKNSANGKTMFAVTMKIQGGPHNGRKIWNNFVVTTDNPNALQFFFQHMNALGLDGAFFKANPSDEAIAAALIGKRCRITTGHRTYQGTVRNDVKAIKPLGGTPQGVPPAAGTIPPTPPPPQPPPAPPTPPPPPAPEPEPASAGAGAAPPPVPF